MVWVTAGIILFHCIVPTLPVGDAGWFCGLGGGESGAEGGEDVARIGERGRAAAVVCGMFAEAAGGDGTVG